jgi:hypothetical protein
VHRARGLLTATLTTTPAWKTISTAVSSGRLGWQGLPDFAFVGDTANHKALRVGNERPRTRVRAFEESGGTPRSIRSDTQVWRMSWNLTSPSLAALLMRCRLRQRLSGSSGAPMPDGKTRSFSCPTRPRVFALRAPPCVAGRRWWPGSLRPGRGSAAIFTAPSAGVCRRSEACGRSRGWWYGPNRAACLS